jgi:hypothetical protein
MNLGDIFGSAISRAGVVRVRNALNPLLWTTAVCSVSFLVAALVSHDPVVSYSCVAVAALSVIVTLGVGVYFAIKHPERLQSEEYRIQHRALQMLYKSGDNAQIVELTKEFIRRERLPGGFGVGGEP